MNIAWWVQRWSELHPEKTAIIFKGETISYRELHKRADRTSCWFQSLGIEKGDRVAAMVINCPEFLEIFLACARLGAIFIPVNFRLAKPELDFTLKNSRPRLFLFCERYIDSVEALGLGKNLPLMLQAVLREPEFASNRTNNFLDYHQGCAAFDGKSPFLTKSLGPADPEEPHVIMYTSGTTGQPKGAVLSHRKTFFNCLNADIFFKLHFDDIMLVVLPLFHSGGLFIQSAPILYKGGTLVIHSKFDPKLTFQDISRYRVTKFLGVPTVYRALLRVPPEERGDLSSLKVCAIGGEKTTVELLRKCSQAGFPLRQIMGQTETSILLWASEEDSLKKPGTVGRPVFHADVEIVDRDGRRVRPGEIGEIVVRGSIMMKEYWQDPVKTEETIKNGWLHTGDLARMDEDGYFYLVDRAKDMYISGGENVYPAEVEKVLRQHPGVEDVAVAGVPDPVWGETGVAFVIPRKGNVLDPAELLDLCDGKLAKYKWPKKVVFCEDFPRTSLGKVRKRILVETHKGKEQEIKPKLNVSKF
ncbi:MAG: long-chain fatty acid--CoA ligase [Deltaproteobacteria bacterium]|nr:long-chain fatty acid--CoA ligase [Deltaproteobacteria bacterium]MBW2015984.1 long-chain fatty acid--CoA ligase [Deltaproteobacteria bacterium]MBW2128950.1 long-chain fatty acid--CoA ligase [Deltaproteobacteria bacterium]